MMDDGDEMERFWKDVIMAYSRYYLSVCLEELRKTTENLGIACVRAEI
jgi:hypothetical protein